MKSGTQKGQLITWNDARGFGFIQPHTGGQQVFLHISAFTQAHHRPQTGDIIGYRVIIDHSGKVRATHAVIEGVPSRRIGPSLTLVVQVMTLALLPFLGALHMAATIRMPIPLFLYPTMSVLTFWLYAEDKTWAQAREWRIPEVVLHGCELAGGWVGAFIAQRLLRHKSRKQDYQIVFWLIVSLHLVFWVGWFVVVGFDRGLPWK